MRRAAAVAIAVVVLMLAALPALAHATLVRTDPVDGSVLEQSPPSIRLEFDEPVMVTASSIRVYNASGARVDRGDADHAATSLEVTVTLPDLPPGAFATTWQVVSADGHPIRGALVFEIGHSGETIDEGLIDELVGEGRSRTVAAVGWMLRWATYLASLIAAGAVVFRHRLQPTALDRVAWLVRWSVVVGIIASLLQIPVFAAESTGLGWGAIGSIPALRDALSSSVAMAALVRVGALAALLIGLGRNLVFWSGLGVVGVVAAEMLTGHTRTTDPAFLVIIAAAVHVFGAAIWIGGLSAFAVVYPEERQSPPEAVRLVRGFSTLATWALVPLLAGGLALSSIQVGSRDALTSTTYGRTLLVKISLAAIVLGVALYNNRVVVPTLTGTRVREKVKDLWGRLGRTVRIELVGLVAVVGVTAMLVNIQPAISALGGPQSVVVPFGQNQLSVIVDPARAGTNEIHLYITTPGGLTPLITGEVTMELSMPAGDIGPIVRNPRLAGPAHFLHVGPELAVAGEWQILLRQRVSDFEEVTAVAGVTIGR